MTPTNTTTKTPRRQTELKQIESLGFGTYMTAKRKLINNMLGTITDNPTIMSIIAGITILIWGWISISALLYYNNLNNKASELDNLSMVDTSILMSRELSAELLKNNKTISDIIIQQQENTKEQKKYQTIINTLQQPLNNFLNIIYLPSLNIRKDEWLHTINTNLIGKNFLEQNPYNDITMIQTRSDFFKQVGNWKQYNEIQDIRIGSISEQSNWFFSLPITLSFTAPDKRNFLLLIDKISLTSHRPNILLINEFTTNLRSAMQQEHQSMLSWLLQSWYQQFISWSISQDRLLWSLLYKQIYGTLSIETPLILTKESIQSAIITSAWCNTTVSIDMPRCILQFREKYREVPQLAYPLTNQSADIVSELISFYRSIPPLLQINSFSFVKQKPTTQSKTNTIWYKWQISLTVYGKWLSNKEQEEISKYLGNICLWSNALLTTEYGLERINTKILALGQSRTTVNTAESQRFVELQQIFTTIKESFNTLWNYQKTIKTFEMYRMLNDSGLCK